MITPERLDRLQLAFAQLLGGFGVAPASAYPVFDRLVESYSDVQRPYHNLEHLGEMFRVAGRIGATPTVNLAIWFHDAVHDPRAKDNEERSADLADECLAPLGVPQLDRVRELILATRHTGAEPADLETAILLDADLAILGASEERYRRYARDIRQEYSFVADADFASGRRRVLESFLARPRLYHSALMHLEGDAPARRNLAGELASLEKSPL